MIFLGVVLVVFQAVFSWAGPLMDGVDTGFVSLSDLVIRIGGQNLWTSLITDGVISGVGGVVIFLPQILLIFLFVALMENSGYLARAATVMDRVFRIVGLQGKSFLPFISSYACAIPGVMAARIIENKRERLATIFVAPFMTCSARLPVYALLIAAFIPRRALIPGILGLQSFTLISMYVVGFAAAMVTAWLMQSRVMKKDLTPFRIEIPPYRWPSFKSVMMLMWNRSKIFLRKAGTVILFSNLIIWALASYPRVGGEVVLEHTFAGRLGKTIEPLIKPLGFDWKIGVGLVASQAAREVIVSTLSTIYSLENADESSSSLQDAVRTGMTPLAGISLMVFFALAMQCMSTVAVVRRETGGWKIPIIQFVYMNGLAYVASLLVYQGGRLLLHG
jgi:ferrous iron transport protein B